MAEGAPACAREAAGLEDVWRSGDANLAMARDRGAMLEAICAVRKRLERVVLVWVPGHRGVSPNEMADVAAGAHLGEQVAGDITRRVARDVQTRDCLYEQHSQYEDGEWALADRRCYRMAKGCMQEQASTTQALVFCAG